MKGKLKFSHLLIGILVLLAGLVCHDRYGQAPTPSLSYEQHAPPGPGYFFVDADLIGVDQVQPQTHPDGSEVKLTYKQPERAYTRLERPFKTATAQVITDDEPPTDTGAADPVDPGSKGGVWDFIVRNWGELLFGLIGLLEVIVRLTPTERDNSIFSFIKFILDKLIPNRRAGEGPKTF